MKALLLTLLLVATTAPAQSPAGGVDETPRTGLREYDLGKAGLALDGYDPVAYFAIGGGKPAKGSKEREVAFRGVRYRFATVKNRELFLAAPERYEPAYGGWCAYAMASNDKTEANPESFLIENGRLLVFYDGFWGDTRKSWLKETGSKLRPKADSRWKGFSKETAPPDVSAYLLEEGVAFTGMDPLSVRSGTPARGELTHALVHAGVTYACKDEESRQAMLEDPTPHTAQYGGWCAASLAEGKRVAPDLAVSIPEEAGILLFSSAKLRDTWQEDAAQWRAKADAAWRTAEKPR